MKLHSISIIPDGGFNSAPLVGTICNISGSETSSPIVIDGMFTNPESQPVTSHLCSMTISHSKGSNSPGASTGRVRPLGVGYGHGTEVGSHGLGFWVCKHPIYHYRRRGLGATYVTNRTYKRRRIKASIWNYGDRMEFHGENSDGAAMAAPSEFSP